MPVTKAQLAWFADTHAWRIPFDTSPRHLAGPGDARHVTHGLAAAGWKRVSDPLSPEIVLRSPDTRYSLHLDPQSSTFHAWWRLVAHPTDTEPGWHAAFGEMVPAEVLGALTDALITPRAAEQPDPAEALEAAGWQRGTGGEHCSADGMCSVERQRLVDSRDDPDWLVETCEPGYGEARGPRLWYARFDERTPAHLVHSFLTALTDRAPLQRGMHDRTAHYNAVQEPSPLTPQQVIDAHTARLDTIRARVRAARRHKQPASSRTAGQSTSPTAAIRTRR